jgi:hypothetical protein
VAGAANERLPPSGFANKLDAEVVGRARGPDSSKVAAEIMHTERWMTFIGVEESERFGKSLLIRDPKLHK